MWLGDRMKKVLFIVRDMRLGGVQKSLLSFLQCLGASEQINEYEIHLLVLDPRGELLKQIPSKTKVIYPPKLVRWMSSRLNKELLTQYCSALGIIGEIRWLLKKKLRLFPKQLNTEQKVWFNWRNLIPKHNETYDIVVSYQDGESNYYAIDKVEAKRKVLWLHSDYQKQRYDPAFDLQYYDSCDAVITVSENCRKCFLEEFPQFEGKTYVLENITSADYVLDMGNKPMKLEYNQSTGTKILSVGRLNWQKGFDIAIGAAKFLRNAGANFLWLVVGEGSERESLQQQIDDSGLSEYFKLVGARNNPYVYMKACDILVQPSRIEGKSIVLDEAKIFCKPIVSTNYSTVSDSLEHGKSGWIVDMTPEALCEGILRVTGDEILREELISYLKNQPKGNVQELQRYIQLMLE